MGKFSQNGSGISQGAKVALGHASQAAPTQIQAAQNRGQYELRKLRGRHHLILQLAARGYKNVDIAKALSITEVTVSYTLNSELGKQKLAALMDKGDLSAVDVILEFQELAPIAVGVLEEILLNDTAKDSDRLSAADKILNGAGVAKKHSLDINIHHVTDDEIKEAKLRARKNASLAGFIIADAEVISETTSDDDS